MPGLWRCQLPTCWKEDFLFVCLRLSVWLAQFQVCVLSTPQLTVTLHLVTMSFPSPLMLSLPHWRFICKLPVQSIHIALECAATPYWVDPFNFPTESFHVNFAPTQLVTAAPDLSLPNYFVTACQLVTQTRKPSKQGFWWGSLNSESP